MARTYISGPINEVSAKTIALFDIAEEALTQAGNTPVNPNKLHKDGMVSIGLRIEALSKCDAIYLLPGWIDDINCRAEKLFAELTGKKVMFHSSEQNRLNHNREADMKADKVAGAVEEVTGKKLCDYAGGPRDVTRYYCRLLFVHFCSKTGLNPSDLSRKYIDRSMSSLRDCLRKYDDELFNPKFRTLNDKVGAILHL